MKYFTTRRILNRNFYNATVFYLNKKTVSDFAENFAFMKLRLVLFSIVKMANLTVFVFLKGSILNLSISLCQTLI